MLLLILSWILGYLFNQACEINSVGADARICLLSFRSLLRGFDSLAYNNQ